MVNPDLVAQLTAIVGEGGVLRSAAELLTYSYDATFIQSRPDLAVLPRSTDEVSRILRSASELHLPVIARGMGSGLAAGSVPLDGGLVLCLTHMNRILEIDAANATVSTEAGVITGDLQAEVERHGLFYPPDPSSVRSSSIGGNIATNAGGPRCLKYGVTGNYVMGLTVVLADGQVLRTGRKVIKDVTGYDLNGLFTGSEGTLGIITEALLRLVAKPRFAATALVEFESLDDASAAVGAILMAGILPAALELMDQTALICVEEALHLGLATDVEASLIVETDGPDEETVRREVEAAAAICRQARARTVRVAQNEAERAALWRARRSVSPALARRAPNKLGEDISVPRSAIPEAARRLRAISRTHGLPIVIFGHAGDGNLHPNILFDRRDPQQCATVEKMAKQVFAMSVELGGTLSGEHGIGFLKRPYLEDALGPVSIAVQRGIKQALDPQNILNPGKVW